MTRRPLLETRTWSHGVEIISRVWISREDLRQQLDQAREYRQEAA